MDKKTNNWQTKKLGEVCSIQTGKYDANHAKPYGKYRFYTCAFDYLYCDTNRFKGECIILPGNGANVGEVFYYNGEFDAYQRTYVLNKIKTDAKYLFYHLLGNWKNINKDKQYGSATNYIRMANFTDYDIPFPPLEIQHAIVSKIEELFSELDKGIAELKTAQQQLKTYRQSVLKSAFEGKLTNENVKDGELPDGWEILKFNDFSKLQRGHDLPLSKIVKGNYPVVTSAGINGYHNEYKANGPCLTTGRSGSVGNINFVEVEKYWPHNTVLFVKDFCGNYPKFVYYFYKQFNFKSFSASTAVPTLDRKQLFNEIVKKPPLKEQHRIVQEIESRLSVADKMEQSIQESLQKAEALRQSILKKAFCGELV